MQKDAEIFCIFFVCRFAYIRRIRKCGASAGMIYAVSRECLFPAYARLPQPAAERLTRLPQRVTERLARLPQPAAERLAYLAVRLRG